MTTITNEQTQKIHDNIVNLLTTGDNVVAALGNNNIDSLTQQNKLLTDKKNELTATLDEKNAAINRYNRDFADVRHEVKISNEVPSTFNFIEDYTLAFLLFAYMFMIVTFIFYRVMLSDSKVYEFFSTFFQSTLVTILFLAFMYYLLN
jgi:hypothetical protein